jgi:uncharacterized surface protein with fasciclin (FAS1) repeats
MNFQRLLSLIKHTLLVAVVLATAGLSGCDNSDDNNGPVTFNGTIVDLINDTQFKQSASVSADVALDSLVKYLSVYPDLTTLLTGSSDVTLFAPSNTAFISLLATPGFPSDIKLINPDIIKGVLAFHIIPDAIKLKADLTSGASFSTAYPVATADDKIIVNSDGTLKTGSSNPNIEITKADNKALNGVVHVIKSVMIPQSVGATLTPILGTAAGTILLGKDFSYLAYLIGYADAGVAVTSKISSVLASPIGTNNPEGITVFAPVNAVFNAAYNAANSEPATNVPTAAQIQSFIQAAWTGGGSGTAAVTLKNHVVMGKYVVTATAGSTTITNNTQVQSLVPVTLTILTGTPINATTNPYGVVVTSPSLPNTSQAPIVKKDLAHSNGIVHAVAGILKPQ